MNRELIWVEVKGRRRETASIVALDLAAANGSALAQFSPGSHIDVHVTEGIVRQYSLLKSEADPAHYKIGVLLCEDTRGGSRFIHEVFQSGHRFQISEPRNHFELTAESPRALLFAGGIGITPILSMAESLQSAGGEFQLHYSVRSRQAAAFLERIGTADFSGRVHLHFDDDDASHLDIAQVLASEVSSRPHLYVCGPQGYMTSVLAAAQAQGWTADRLHKESFRAELAASPQDAEFEVQLARSGVVVRVPPGHSIVSALAEHGIAVPVSCEQGLCGCCLTRVIAGVPDHRDFYMSDAEHAANDQMTLCCSRSRSARLVLDL